MHILKIRKSLSDKPQRRGFFIALSLLLISLSPGLGKDAKLPSNSAIILNTLGPGGTPIPYVSLILRPENIWVMSDEQGRLMIERGLLNNDSLLVQRIGYASRSLAFRDVLRSGVIKLEPLLIKGQTIMVSDHRSQEILAPALLQFAKSDGQGLLDHAQMLQRIPGMSIRSYGGPAGISTMSMDGGPSSHTKVLVDEIDITSSQNGEADLSQIPLPYIESMSYVPYDITNGGSGSIDGEIKLVSGHSRNQVSFSSGSYGHRAFDFTLNVPLLGFQSAFQLGQRHETADYPFEAYQRAGTRSNNQMDQQFLAIRASKMLRPDLFLRITGLESHQSRGAAGLIWSPDTLSHRNDMLRLLGATLGQIRVNGNTSLQFSLRGSNENYKNPYLLLDSQHALQTLGIKLRDERRLHPSLQVISDFNWSRARIESSDARVHTRESWEAGLSGELELGKAITLVPSFKSQYSPALYHESFGDMQIVLRLPWSFIENISASQGQIFNYPTFNDLFWEPGGNPDLKPERTEVQTIQTKLNLHRLGNIMLQWQNKESANLIQWMPVHSYWQPNNVLNATRESQKLTWELDIPEIAILFYTHYARIFTLDQSLDKALRYAPSSTASASLSWHPDPAEFHLDYHYVSERISMYSWPEDVMVKTNQIWRASASWTWSINRSQYTLVMSGDNLLDVNYESIRGYPEPGRSYRITANYSF